MALVSAGYGGTETYSGKDSKQVMPAPCPTWFADAEWNVNISGVYAPTTNEYREDTYLQADHGWGGAIDAKYFFRRYFGIGVQGFGLGLGDNDDNGNRRVFHRGDSNDFVGGALGTFTFRYPIPCTRFAPYVWAGVGAIFGGNDHGRLVFDDDFIVNDRNNDDARLMGQYGGGFEVRFTPRIGWTNDVSFNQVDGSRNDFIQVRTGLNFAF